MTDQPVERRQGDRRQEDRRLGDALTSTEPELYRQIHEEFGITPEISFDLGGPEPIVQVTWTVPRTRRINALTITEGLQALIEYERRADHDEAAISIETTDPELPILSVLEERAAAVTQTLRVRKPR